MRKSSVLVLAFIAAIPAAALIPPAGADHDGPHATIVRDSWGVAHIYADDAYSLFYANGYAQAQDRLAQMEILRHVGKGTLASLTGPSGLVLDLETRRELYTDAEREAAWDALVAADPVMAAGFAAFADGVNAWIDEVKTDPSKLPVEYPALGILPEPWTVMDTIAVAQYLLDVFGRGSGGQEVSNAKLLDALDGDFDAFADLVWVDHDTYTTIKPGDDPTPFQTPAAERRLGPGDIVAAQEEAMAAALLAAPVDDTHVVGEVRVPLAGPSPDPALAAVRANVGVYALGIAREGLKWGSN
ncbi:MAG TPA: penicillin acylase family protein, partial [Candidatus Thermoplasmatota archaeon]|nr:penicillin acylase family protein [Candidatus Thermoplasmatota archaeon]